MLQESVFSLISMVVNVKRAFIWLVKMLKQESVFLLIGVPMEVIHLIGISKVDFLCSLVSFLSLNIIFDLIFFYCLLIFTNFFIVYWYLRIFWMNKWLQSLLCFTMMVLLCKVTSNITQSGHDKNKHCRLIFPCKQFWGYMNYWYMCFSYCLSASLSTFLVSTTPSETLIGFYSNWLMRLSSIYRYTLWNMIIEAELQWYLHVKMS